MDRSSQPDPKKVWVDFKQEFLQNSFKIIKRDVKSYNVTNSQILSIIRNSHKHQRENYMLHQSLEKEKQKYKKNREN